MRSLGITRRIDPLGRLVIPKETRRMFGIKEGDPLEIFTDGDTIVLKKYVPGCIFCDSVDNLKEYKGKNVCTSCGKGMKA